MSLVLPSRRGLLLGLGASLAAPAVVRASSLMPVRRPNLLRITRRGGFVFTHNPGPEPVWLRSLPDRGEVAWLLEPGSTLFCPVWPMWPT